MAVIDIIKARAKALGKTLVLPEGQDPRVVKAANMIADEAIAKNVIVLGSAEEIDKACAEAGVAERKFEAIDYLNCDFFQQYVEQFCEMRAKKGCTMDKALKTMSDRIYFSAMMVRNGKADALVAGSIASTADMLRAAFQCIGTAPGIKIGSSCFVMDLATPAPNGENTLMFADCAVNPNPNAEQLVDIALATAATYRSLFGKQPKVAFLSFSSFGSAEHELLEKVVAAAKLCKERVAAENLDIIVDGELQADAAIVPSVAKSKAAGSAIQGDANVLIFPDLNAGNICYKLVQRLGKADAFGPVLQGLAKPMSDLSRGCSAEDIVGASAIAICQSAQ
ncbi:MAG: phosphate acetyltransferase [Lentisphaeria bacterium]|nr:phosphate acetyltransferase [Lentisphaeria bacterium]